MSADLSRVLGIELTVRVRLGERALPLRDVLALRPGSLLELPKSADDDLDLLVGERMIGAGAAVKVGENYGLRVSTIGPARERIEAMGAG